MERVRTQKEIRRAIHRSREFRARRERKRRRSVLLATGAAAAALIGFEFSVASFGGMSIAEAATNQTKSLLDLLDERSPGERTAGELTKTKSALADEERPTIVPKNLAEVLAPPALEVASADIGTPPAALPTVPPSPPGAFLLPPPGGGVGGNPPPGGGVIVPPGGGGNPPPGPPNQPPGPPDQPPGPPDQPPPLPEPGTWMTMILGFGIVGWKMRRNRHTLALN